MIFIIDNHYCSNHEENCIIISNKWMTIEEMTCLIGSLAIFHLRCTGYSCTPKDLLQVLCKKFECTDRYEHYVGEMDFFKRRLFSPTLHNVFVMHGKFVIWTDLDEAVNYCMDKMWTVLNEYFTKEELEQLEAAWSA